MLKAASNSSPCPNGDRPKDWQTAIVDVMYRDSPVRPQTPQQHSCVLICWIWKWFCHLTNQPHTMSVRTRAKQVAVLIFWKIWQTYSVRCAESKFGFKNPQCRIVLPECLASFEKARWHPWKSRLLHATPSYLVLHSFELFSSRVVNCQATSRPKIKTWLSWLFSILMPTFALFLCILLSTQVCAIDDGKVDNKFVKVLSDNVCH